MDPTPARPTTRYGSVGDWGEWRGAIEEYYWDRMEPAFELAVSLGVGVTGAYEGWYRTIEAETVTRRESELVQINDWLTLEASSNHHELGHFATQSCETVCRRFGVSERPPTLLTVLSEEADAPWAVGRYGYMTDKYPYDKICVPMVSVGVEHEFDEVVSHEYAHVMVLQLTQGRAPRWLNEGVAMLAECRSDLTVRRAFAAGEAPWLSPRELEHAHSATRQGEPHPQRTWRAYQQSAWIGRYLVSLQNEEAIGKLLRAFADNSAWTEIKMRVTGQTAADEALKQVYGFGEDEAFARTLEWLRW